jgi:hypothetical protein
MTRPDRGVPMTRAMPAELAEILEEIVPPGHAPGGGPGGTPGSGPGGTPGSGPGGAFRHRQHVHLAFIAVRRFGAAHAAEKVGGWIRYLTAHAPQKYHATITRAWTEIVAHHVAADPSVADFDVFAERHPALLDKRLLTRHYTAAVLASPQARAGWVEPDLAAFGWPSGAARP